MDGNTEVERGTRRWLGDSKRGARKSTVNLAGRRWHTRAVLRMVNGNVRKATMRQTGESERERDNNRERAIERKREAESTSESERELEPEIEDLGAQLDKACANRPLGEARRTMARRGADKGSAGTGNADTTGNASSTSATSTTATHFLTAAL